MAKKKLTDKQEKRSVMGRPALYKTAKALEKKASEYFDYCKEEKKVPNIAGLCWFCDFTDRRSFTEQGERGKDFSDTVKKIKNQLYAEKFDLAATGKMDRTIFIFDAVNNHDMFNTRSENKNDNKHEGNFKGVVRIEYVDPDNTDTKET